MRTEGAKNRPKTTKELVKLLQEAADREGVEFSPQLLQKVQGSDTERKEAEAEIKEKFSNLEIVMEDDAEVDTYKCGSCHTVMASALPNCPNCGEKLNWN